MLGRRDIDRHTDWSVDYQGEEYTTRATNFVIIMKNKGCLIYMMIYPNVSTTQP